MVAIPPYGGDGNDTLGSNLAVMYGGDGGNDDLSAFSGGIYGDDGMTFWGSGSSLWWQW